LMKYTLQHCPEFFVDHITVAYFFNARGDSLEKTPLGMLRSMTYQLLEQDLLYERFLSRFRDKEKKHEKWEWREAELKEILLLETKTPQSKPILFLIDALDECRESDVRDVVEFLEKLSINAVSANVTLNICLSSRHYPNISMKRRLDVVMEEETKHNYDIARYAHDNLKKQYKDIEIEILKKAAGVFMWVRLVVEILNRAYDDGKVEAMQQKLRELPGDLEQVFETLLSKDNPDRHETVFMLQFVLFARRTLQPEELYFAMIAGTNAKGLGAWDRIKVTSEDIRRRITSSSKGLIEIRKGEDNTVQFIHETVNDFLLRNGRFQTLDPTLESNPIGTSHNCLKDCCMSYLMIGRLQLPKDRSAARDLTSSYPFLQYASTYVLDHAEEAQRRGVLQTKFLHRLQKYEDFERLRHFHSAFEIIPSWGWSKGVTPLYALEFQGCHQLMKIILSESRIDVNAQGGPLGSVLQVAAAKGKEEIVWILLEKGADVNAQGGLYGSALQAAAANGNEKILGMLLEKGADVNAQGGLHGSALQVAAAKGKEEIVWMLLEKGADVNAQGGLFGSALQAAAIHENENILGMLLEKGADVNAQGGVFGSAMQAAAVKGNEEIVEILLKKEADVNAQGGLYGSALRAAVAAGDGGITWMLREKGADVNTQGGFYGSTLHEAAVRGKGEIVEMMLEKGANVNAQGGLFGNALQAAIIGGRGRIVGILLEKGVDVNAQGGLFGNALQAAVSKREERMVEILLEKGADVNAQGGPFGSALQAAALIDKGNILEMLLRNGADVNALGGPFGSALQAAVFRGKEFRVEILLEKGADVNAQGGLYGSALGIALADMKEEIAWMLLEKGADVNAQGGLYGSALKANWCGTHCGENDSHGDDSVNRLTRTQQKLGRLVLVATAFLAVFFISRLSIRRQLKVRP